jgi:hypothetical protein
MASNDILMFYTEKAGLTSEGLKKLKAAGFTAVKVTDVKEISWPNPDQCDWLSLQNEMGVAMVRALAMSHGGGEMLGKVLLGVMRRKMGIGPDGSIMAKT